MQPCCLGRPLGSSRHLAQQAPLSAFVPQRQPRRVAVQFFREDRAAATPESNGVYPKPYNARASEAPAPAPSPSTSTTNGHAGTATTAATPSTPPPPGFVVRRLLVFSGLVLGYAAYYLTRNSLTYTAPLMVEDPALRFSMQQVGTLTSIFPIAYGSSKLLSGIVGDRFSPSLLLGLGLMATAGCNLALGAGSGLAWFAAMWALNGLMQGVGAPSCARILTAWFDTYERGTYWGLWNVAHNTGGFVSPLLVATAAHAAGWRWGMWAPGLAALLLGGYVLLVCRDTPRDAGFNLGGPREQPTAPDAGAATGARADGNGAGTSKADSGAAGGQQQQQGQQQSLWRTAMDNVLSNPYVWAMALTYLFVYVVRQGVTSWSVFYLMKEKGVPDVAQAAVRVSGLELGGLLGGLVAGRLSDLLIRRDAASAQASGGGGGAAAGSVGRRVQAYSKVIMAYTAALAAALALFHALPAGTPAPLQWLSVAAIGFCIYGPQMMIGLCGAELVHPASVGASQGVLGWVAYLGAANAGVPLSHIITRFGWPGYFATLAAACGLALLLLAPMARLRSYSEQQRQEELSRQSAVGGGAAAAAAPASGGAGGAVRPSAA